MIPLELVVEEHPDVGNLYRVVWCDEPDSVLICNIPEVWIDLIPFMVARQLLAIGNSPDRLLIVRLRGADFDLMRAPLGVLAATPLLNTDHPVTKPGPHCVYRDRKTKRRGRERPTKPELAPWPERWLYDMGFRDDREPPPDED